MKQTITRLVRLEQSAGSIEAAPILAVAEFSEVPAGTDPRTIIIRTGVPRASGRGVR